MNLTYPGHSNRSRKDSHYNFVNPVWSRFGMLKMISHFLSNFKETKQEERRKRCGPIRLGSILGPNTTEPNLRDGHVAHGF